MTENSISESFFIQAFWNNIENGLNEYESYQRAIGYMEAKMEEKLKSMLMTEQIMEESMMAYISNINSSIEDALNSSMITPHK